MVSPEIAQSVYDPWKWDFDRGLWGWVAHDLDSVAVLARPTLNYMARMPVPAMTLPKTHISAEAHNLQHPHHRRQDTLHLLMGHVVNSPGDLCQVEPMKASKISLHVTPLAAEIHQTEKSQLKQQMHNLFWLTMMPNWHPKQN